MWKEQVNQIPFPTSWTGILALGPALCLICFSVPFVLILLIRNSHCEWVRSLHYLRQRYADLQLLKKCFVCFKILPLNSKIKYRQLRFQLEKNLNVEILQNCYSPSQKKEKNKRKKAIIKKKTKKKTNTHRKERMWF